MTARVAPWAAVARFRGPAGRLVSSNSSPDSTAQMWRGAIVQCLKSESADADFFWGNTRSSGFGGWRIFYASGSFIADVGGVGSASVALPPVPGTLCIMQFRYDAATGNLDVRVGVSSATTGGGGAVTPGPSNVHIGEEPGSGLNDCDRFGIVALMAAAAAPDLAATGAILADNFAQGRDLDTGLGFAPSDYLDAADFVPPDTDWVDRISGKVYTVNGSLELRGVPGRAA